MHGPQILAQFLAVPNDPDNFGNVWQYNSRSDKHSQVGCWGVAFDLLATSALLRRHAEQGKVVLGVNHSMQDWTTQRQKKLDLVVARPAGSVARPRQTFKGLAVKNRIVLDELQTALLDSLPDIPVAPVAAVLMALEAKAAMTAHIKARPRIYDELNSSHLCVHGASDQALAIGYVQINLADRFASSVTNNRPLNGQPPQITQHHQPRDTERLLEKIAELPRRHSTTGVGFDGIGVTVIDFDNLGHGVSLVTTPPAPQPGDAFHYDTMIVRMANEYDSRFHAI